MIHDLKPYPTTKGSGVPWLGEVPEPLDEEDAYQKMNSLLKAQTSTMKLRRPWHGDRLPR